MASSIDKENMRNGNSNAEQAYNYQIAVQQGEKTSFRAHKTALNADPFNPSRVDNAMQQKLSD